MSLDDRIDELYRLPLSEFTAARNALAKSLGGPGGSEDAKRIRALVKPTLVPWTVNQLFWNARLVYERLMKSGEMLRAAQIAALNRGAHSKPADVTRASDAHRAALAEAVRQATRVAGIGGAKPDADELSRTLESLSLAPTRPEHPGRLTEPVRPAGFEALAGVSASLVGSGFPPPLPGSEGELRRDSPKRHGRESGSRIAPAAGKAPAEAGAHTSQTARAPARAGAETEKPDSKRAADAKRALAEAAAAERRHENELAARKRKAEAALNAAEQDFARSKAAELKAREALDHAERAREEAHARLVAARKFLASNF